MPPSAPAPSHNTTDVKVLYIYIILKKHATLHRKVVEYGQLFCFSVERSPLFANKNF